MTTRTRKSTAPAATPGVTTVSEWKKESGPLLELPSGKRVKVMEHPNMRVFMKAGIIPNSLVGVVQEALDKGKTPDVASLIADEKQVDEMFELVDAIMCFVVQEPKISPVPKEDEERDDSVLYADDVEQTDKMFIFQWATGGTRDLERFRKEYNASLGAVPGIEDVVGKTIKSSRDRR